MDVANNFIGENLGASGSLIAGTPNANGSFVGTSLAPLDPLLGPLDNNGDFGVVNLLTHANLANSGNNGVRDRGQDAGAPTTDTRLTTCVWCPHGHRRLRVSEPRHGRQCQRPHRYDPGRLAAVPQFCRDEQRGQDLQRRALSVTLPPNTTVVTASVDFTVSGDLVSLAVADLAAQAKSTITLTITPNSPGPFTATATLGADPDLSNNSAAVSLTVMPGPTPTPTPTPTATPTPTPTRPPTIIGEQVLFTRKLNRRGKPEGKPVLTGFELEFSAAMNPATAGNASNYQLGWTSTKRVKKKVVTILHPIAFRVQYRDSNDSVSLLLSGKGAFTKGGQLTVIAAPPGGVSSAAGVLLDGNNEGIAGDNGVLMILPKARGITP